MPEKKVDGRGEKDNVYEKTSQSPAKRCPCLQKDEQKTGDSEHHTATNFDEDGIIKSNFPFLYRQRCELTAGSDEKKKHSATPPGIEPGSSDCRSGALTTELRSHNRNCVRIFRLSPSCQFFFCFCFCPTDNRKTGKWKTQVRSPPGLRCVFFFFRLIQLSVHIFVGKEKESLIAGMVPTGTNFR